MPAATDILLPRRSVLVALFVLTVTLALVLAVLVAHAPGTSDFRCLWNGARFVLDGRDPYDGALWTASLRGQYIDAFGTVGGAPCPGSYAYPLWTAVAMAPLARMPLGVATVLWELALVIVAAVSPLALGKAMGLGRSGTLFLAVVLFLSEPLWQQVLTGQLGAPLLIGIVAVTGGAASLRSSRLGIASFLLILKPHVAPVVLVDRVRAAQRPARITALTVGLATVAASFLVRPGWLWEWLRELTGHRLEMVTDRPTTLYGVASRLTGRSEIAFAGVVLALVIAIGMLRDADLSDAADRVGVGVALWFLVVPYLIIADQLALLVAWAVIIRRAIASRSRLLLLLVVLTVDVVPWLCSVVFVVGGPFLNAVAVPLMVALLIWALRVSSPSGSPSGLRVAGAG